MASKRYARFVLALLALALAYLSRPAQPGAEAERWMCICSADDVSGHIWSDHDASGESCGDSRGYGELICAKIGSAD